MFNHDSQSQYTVRVALAEDSPIKGENLWAEKVGLDLYRLCNTPFFAQGLAWGDVVRCKLDEAGNLEVDTVVDHSGNNTMRVYFERGWDSAIDKVIGYLTYVGCTFENSGRLYAFYVPNEPELKISIAELTTYLNELEQSGIASWETGNWPKNE